MSAAGHLHAVPGFDQKTTHCFARLAYQTEGSMKRGRPGGVAEQAEMSLDKFCVDRENQN